MVQEYGTDTTADLSKWIVVGLTGTGGGEDITEAYSTNGVRNQNSLIDKTIGCFDLSNTGTNLSTPFDMARVYLQNNGRPGVKQGIIFETDGEPNYNQTQDQSNYTCAESVAAANRAKAANIEIFTIGFGVESLNCPDGGGSVVNHLGNIATGPVLGGSTCSTNGNENRDGDHFFCRPTGQDLSAVFQEAAVQLAGIRSHLVQVYPAPFVNSVSPSTAGANATITVFGEGFTGANKVTFGNAVGTIIGTPTDTSLSVRVPAGSGTVDVQVTTPGGTSPTHQRGSVHLQLTFSLQRNPPPARRLGTTIGRPHRRFRGPYSVDAEQHVAAAHPAGGRRPGAPAGPRGAPPQ